MILKIKEILIVNLAASSAAAAQPPADTVPESQSLVVFTDGMLVGNINSDSLLPRSPSPNPADADAATAKLTASSNAAANATSSKFERKVTEEVVKLFQENNGSFYFCRTYDLTNSVERQQDQIEAARQQAALGQQASSSSYWRRCDDRFFWNKVLLGDLIALIDDDDDDERTASSKDSFVLPLIQGFVEIETYENRSAGRGQHDSLQHESAREQRHQGAHRGHFQTQPVSAGHPVQTARH